ncbi:hypothetical protein OEZ86_001716 [Tetradesmus obliquus]|nr:hypothetical protein OEZ86_001716 [Tetradesmus obliquus]
MEEQQLLQELGVAVQDAAELEQDIIGKALAESPAAGPSADVPDGEAGTSVSPEQLAGQLLAAELEAEAVTLVLQAQQQQLQQEEGDDWNATDEQAAAQATERSSRQLEAALGALVCPCLSYWPRPVSKVWSKGCCSGHALYSWRVITCPSRSGNSSK